MPPDGPQLTQDNIWAEIPGVPGTWTTVTGVTKSRNITKMRKGGQINERSTRSKPSFSDLTLTLRPETANVSDVLAAIERIDNTPGGAISAIKYLADELQTVVGRRTYSGVLKEFTDPEGDVDSTGYATVVVVISVDEVQ